MPYNPDGSWYQDSSQTPEQQSAQLAWMMSMYGLDPNNPDDLAKFQQQYNGTQTSTGAPLAPPASATATQQAGQLGWMMSMYGLDPNNPDDLGKFQEQWNGATTIPGSTLPNNAAGRAQSDQNRRDNARSNPVSQSSNWSLLDDYNTSRQGVNTPFIQDYANQVNGANGANLGYVQPVAQAAGKVSTAADALGQQTAGWQQQSAQSAQRANAADQATLGTYTGKVNDLTNFSNQNYQTYANNLNAQPILSAAGYGADVQSQAAGAHASLQDIQNQNQAYSQLGQFANGMYDYTSKASKAAADPWADQQYRTGINELSGIAHGSKDVRVGEADPGAYAAAVDARNQFGALTTPQLTAAERFIYEQGRQQQEQGERALRGARVNSLRERGMGGGAAEQLAGMLGSRQMSQNSVLGGLGAMANAQGRAMTALQGYAGVSNAMNAQANDIAQNNANRQLAAQGMYVDASGQLRRDTFQESYQKGVAADRATEFNTSTRLNATQAQGQLASTMRQQSFNEDFSTRSAADQMAQFNKSQSQISQRWQEQYAADQQAQYTNRQTGINQAGQANANFGLQSATGVANAGFGVNAAADQRTQGSVMNQNALGTSSIAGYGAAASSQLGAGTFGVNVNNGNLANSYGATGLQITDNNAITNRGINSYLNKQGANSADIGMQIAAGAGTSAPKTDDGYDNDFDRWQNGK
jgi:hypothetical protein